VTLEDIAADGTVLAIASDRQYGVLVQREGSTIVTDLGWLDGSGAMQVSPTGDALLLNEGGDAGGSFYVRKLDGSPAVRLGAGTALAWSPDGGRILSTADGTAHDLVPVGAGTSKHIAHPGVDAYFAWFDPNGRILVNGRMGDQPYRFWWMDESGKLSEVGPSGVDHWVGQYPLSNDGRLIAAFARGGPDGHIVSVFPIDGGTPIPVLGREAGEVVIRFTADDRHLLVYNRDRLPARIFSIDYRTGARTLWREFTPADPAGIAGIPQIVMTPDSRVVAYNYSRSLGTAFLVTGLK
jgi:WD40 repeat protein